MERRGTTGQPSGLACGQRAQVEVSYRYHPARLQQEHRYVGCGNSGDLSGVLCCSHERVWFCL